MGLTLKAVLVILLVWSHHCYSQSSNLGVKGGFNAATITGYGIEGHIGVKAGYHLGLVGQLKLNEKWILQPEILFSNQGYRTEDFKYSFNYFNLPILLRRQYKKFFFDFGPQVGLLMNAKKIGHSDSEDITGEMDNLELSLATGVGFRASKNIGLECRYTFDLPNPYEDEDSEFYNSVIQFSVFYVFK